MDKAKAFRLVRKYFLIIVGCFLLAFGDAAFISPLGLVTGGVLSIGVITQHFVDVYGNSFYVVDIVTWIILRFAGSMVVSQSWSSFISPNPL